jgi:hypothetical protein
VNDDDFWRASVQSESGVLNAFCARSGICASIQNKTWRKATNNFSNKVFDGIAAEEKASDAKMP